jgi:uncharacterized cupin superfamily protein
MHRAVVAKAAAARAKSSNYPEPFASRMAGRVKRPLGDLYGLKNFGVNLTHWRWADHHRSSTVIAGKMSSSMSLKATLSW